ncbi:LysM peptidoglycan-binding domain-containing protein [Paenibacillus sp. NFR01]|uniref:LysM peptidoglycan-binding domain-containing protein n=1 Tax=Paenibacillus sp. NFR01 TaxID=1566279 RepID=UPI0008AC7952|nr:LysM peptidoglycan-binding domain-containing protein [Paenibacillus sp. NFR01]SEU17537.1 morphogenetic protein associated with SpoVID [Paenibacillus sp. NFR01]
MKIHIVKQGDTLYALSQKYGVPLEKVIEANPQIANPDVLAVGDKVKIPAGVVPVPDSSELYYKHTVKQGDTLWKLSKAWGVTLKEMIDANPQLKNPNALMTGEVVNIPKKATSAPVMPDNTMVSPTNNNDTMVSPATNNTAVSPATDKTVVGGTAYTGPKKSTAPIVSPAAEEKPAPAPAPAPVVEEAAEKAPEKAALPETNVAPVANKAPEIAPVQEIVHEKQSLFVQITVPAQEAMTKEATKSDVQPLYMQSMPSMPCDKTAGYPGIQENPYTYAYPSAYPTAEAMPYMSYAPEAVSPYSYLPTMQENMNASAYDMNPCAGYPSYVSPEYAMPMSMPAPMPWPDCGCGGMTIQPYPYEHPAYGTQSTYPAYAPSQPETVMPHSTGMPPMYGMPNQPESVMPYSMGTAPQYGTPNQPEGVMPYSMMPMYGMPVTANIPPYPVYPAAEELTKHNRVPEILVPEVTTPAINASSAAVTEAKGKSGSAKSGSAKAKVSGLPDSKTDKAVSKKRSNQARANSSGKKSKNPWIPN